MKRKSAYFLMAVLLISLVSSCCFKEDKYYLERDKILQLNIGDTLVYCNTETDSCARYLVDFSEQRLEKDVFYDECPARIIEFQTILLKTPVDSSILEEDRINKECGYNLRAEEFPIIIWDNIGFSYATPTQITDTLIVSEQEIGINLRMRGTYYENPVTRIEYSYSHGVVRYWYGDEMMELTAILKGGSSSGL